MKNLIWIFLIFPSIAFSQIKPGQKEDAAKIHDLIDHYSEARENEVWFCF